MRMVFIPLIVALLTFPPVSAAWEIVPLSESFYSKMSAEYGHDTAQRFRALQEILLREQNLPLTEELAAVNRFFNYVQWRDDLSHWGKKDYWQTPLETLISFSGDCEDIAIAKYTALRMLGVPDDKLAIVYVTITRLPRYNKTAHMVLAYYENHDSSPLILDSIDPIIKTSNQRPDLRSVYEFNTTTLWLTDHHLHKLGKDHKSSRLGLENELKERLSSNRKHLTKLNGGKPFYPFYLDTL
ncbi:MAG: hypothetical protein GY784_07990 [Gammaproteobacteria bacterium]|nr:hypothetical protein [Gammaproteobacteria bacterium]